MRGLMRLTPAAVTGKASEAKRVWSAQEREEQVVSEDGATNRFQSGILLLQNGLFAEARLEFHLAFELLTWW
jgi:hypothetical protein